MKRIGGFLGKIHILISKWLISWSWTRDAKRLKSKKQIRATVKVNQSAKFLILAPHSDDEWIGCSQIITNCPNSVICSMEMNGGDDEATHQIRLKEMKHVASFYKRKFVCVSDDKIESLTAIINTEHPDYICCPIIYDWHPEHQKVISLLQKAVEILSYSGSILSYHVSVPMPMRLCNVAFPMSKDAQRKKWDVFTNAYKSQSFMAVNRFMKQEEIDGGVCDSFSAELYNCQDANSWVQFVNRNQLSKVDSDQLKLSINNISDIRKLVEKMVETN